MHSEEEARQSVLKMADVLAPHGLPHVMVPHLDRGDIIVFELPMTSVSVRVLNPIYVTMAPIKWRFFKGYMKYHGALDEVSRTYHPMALIPGYGARFGHPGDSGTYVDISPTEAITINGQAIQ